VGSIRVGGKEYFADTLEMMKRRLGQTLPDLTIRSNTVIGVIATNVKLTKSEATKVAQMAHDGLARTVRPAHTMLDGDTIFALSTGNKNADVTLVGSCAAQVMAHAIVRAAMLAKSAGGLPGIGEQGSDNQATGF
jgi:L-aminopeptidase/D-esterase-like protein